METNIDELIKAFDEYVTILSEDEEEVDFPIVGCGDPTAFKVVSKEKVKIRDLDESYDADKYHYFSNKGICRIGGKTRYNCCIFIVMAKIFKTCKKDLFESLRKKSRTDVDTIIQLFRKEYPEHLIDIDNKQSDILLDFFSKWSNIKIRLIYMIQNNESINHWDLYDGNDEPDALVFQYPNHFECAIKKYDNNS